MRTRLRVGSVVGLLVAVSLLAAAPAAFGAKPSKADRVNKHILELFSKDKDTRLSAVTFLGWEGGPRAMEALGKVLRTSDEEMRVKAIDALAKADTEGAKVLTGYLGDSDVEVEWRLKVVAAAGKAGGSVGFVPLRVAIRDADPRVRAKAVFCTGRIIEWLIRDANVKAKDRVKAAGVVLKGKGKGAMAAIMAGAKDKSPEVRFAVALLLARLAPDVGAAAIKALEDDTDDTVRVAVEWAAMHVDGGLLDWGDKQVLAKLKKKLPSLDLSEMNLEQAIQFLREVSGVSIHVNWWALNEVGVTKQTKVAGPSGGTLAEAFDSTLFRAGGHEIDWWPGGGSIYISSAASRCRMWANAAKFTVLKPDHDPKNTARSLDRYRMRVPVAEFPADVPLELMVQFMREVARIPIHVRWHALKAANVDRNTVCNIHLVDVTGKYLLGMIFTEGIGSKECAIAVCGGAIIISARTDIAALSRIKRPKGMSILEAMVLAELKRYLDPAVKKSGSRWSDNPVAWLVAGGDQLEILQNVLASVDAEHRLAICTGLVDLAVGSQSVDMVKYILDQGGDIEHRTSSGTSLHIAARQRGSDIVSLLIARGAKVNAVSENGTPLTCAEAELAEHLGKLKDATGEGRQWRLDSIAKHKKVIDVLRKNGGKAELGKSDRESRD